MSGSGEYTTTPNLGLFKPTYNADAENWGFHLNSNSDILDGALLPLTGGQLTGSLNILNNSPTQSAMTIMATAPTQYNGVPGIWSEVHNTGGNAAQGQRFSYLSSSGGNGFDIGITNLAIFDPVFIAGQTPFSQAEWHVAVSPNDTTHNWSCIIAEMNITNRGADMGWKRDRTGANPTGGYLFVPETNIFGGTGGGEGKNATFALSVGHSGGTNSTGFPAKFYNGMLFEPNAIVGLTGRAIYATGDITGTASQYPYGPMQTDGTWLHGIDHTLAVYQDTHAETLKAGQSIAWINGTTAAPTATATVTGTGSGTNISLALNTAGSGAVTVNSTAPLLVNLGGQTGSASALSLLNANVTAGNAVYAQIGVDTGSAAGSGVITFLRNATASQSTFRLGMWGVPNDHLQLRGDNALIIGAPYIGFYGATPVAKQTGVPVTIAAVHAALTSLGLIAP